MNKELKGVLRGATKGVTIRNDVWEAYIDLPKHGGSIAVCSTNKDEAVKIRQIILDALHAHAHGKEEDPDAWRERNRRRQAAGVKFEFHYGHGVNDWCRGKWDFDEGNKEDYREVPYEPKPAKLTAKIVREDRWGIVRKQDWEFYGTPEGYRVECEKYGYAVVSEIKKVVEKPKTLKYYFALVKDRAGCISVEWTDEANISTLRGLNNGWSGHTIIGDIEEREVPIE